MGEPCTIRVNGVERVVPAGAMLAAVLSACGEHATRRCVSGEARGPLCGMGVCFECRASVHGVAHVRTCTVPVRTGMDVRIGAAAAGDVGLSVAEAVQETACDVLVVGGGPAGLAAASTAAELGRRVVLLDDNPALGGQIWRKDASARSRFWRDRVHRAGVRIECGATVVGPMDARRVLTSSPAGTRMIGYENIILATGATELFLPFPGWTLPNVMGVGGLQAMVKGGLDIRDKGVVIVGSGPLLFAVGAGLRRAGADVRIIAEQAALANLRGLMPQILTRPRKLLQGTSLKVALLDVEQRFGWWPLAAEGTGRVQAVTLTNGRAIERFTCDYLATGFGLVPRTRAATVLGCRTARDGVLVDELQRASVAGVYAAGECTGIGGVDKALVEGRIAGLACAGREQEARRLKASRDRELAFARALAEAFALRGELRDIVKPGTIVCRCEDVRWGDIAAFASWREAKLQTRCGMGPCQGCVCGPAVGWLTGWPVEDARPPVLNVPLRVLAAMGAQVESVGGAMEHNA